ncbi:FkbM family methyltransferase [Geminicoccaceae bacterium 1502E]|nr:FkbM family methyltransferase [Geminicoccaceae bacterium 1502E]
MSLLASVSRTAAFIVDHPLGSRQPVRSLAIFAAWQLMSRVSRRPRIVKFAGQTRLLARAGETGITGNIYVGLHEFTDMAFVTHALRSGDLFGDVGANAGSYTILAAGVAGADVVAVEPVPETLERLKANIELNELDGRVRVCASAVGARSGTARFSCNADTTNKFIDKNIVDNVPSMEVSVRTIDSIFERRAPEIIKVDVEGFEAEVLEGAARVLPNPALKALVIEVLDLDVDRATGSLPVADTLASHGFDAFAYDPWTRELVARPDGDRRGNVIFVRDVDFVRHRLAQAPRMRVRGLEI